MSGARSSSSFASSASSPSLTPSHSTLPAASAPSSLCSFSSSASCPRHSSNSPTSTTITHADVSLIPHSPPPRPPPPLHWLRHRLRHLPHARPDPPPTQRLRRRLLPRLDRRRRPVSTRRSHLRRTFRRESRS